MEGFLFLATIYLAATVVAVPLAARLGLGSVLGYLAAGIVIGPLLGLVGHSETQDLRHFAEFGVVMMLFLIGLELEPKTLWDMRHRLIGLGGLQILATMGLVMGVAILLGQSTRTGLAIGMIMALSSTAIVLQTLSEKGLMQTSGGRSAFSVLLTQDIAVIPMLAVLPLLAGAYTPVSLAADGSINRDLSGAASHGSSILHDLPGWAVTLATIGAVAVIILAGVYLTRPVFRFVHLARLRELYTAMALLIVVGIASLMNMVGLSPALGTFLAGVVLANTEFRHELESDIEPFKGLLLGLFFITVGAGINFAVLSDQLLLVVGLTLALMASKGLILYVLALLFKLKGRDKWLFTLSLAQAGEFGFVLISFSLQTNVLGEGLAEILLLVVALSMLLTPLFFIAQAYLARRLKDKPEDVTHDEVDDQQPVIIAGIGRFGQVVNRLLQGSGFNTTVLDHDLKTIQLMRKFGFKGFFGDPTRPELLHAAGLKTAKVIVVALDDPKATNRLVTYVRQQRPDIFIIARARDRVHVYQLYKAGADKIVRETFDSSLRAGRYALEELGLMDYEASELEHAFFRHDREALRSLAEVWDPAIPVTENAAYMARSKEMDKVLEDALINQLEQSPRRKMPPGGDGD